MSTPVQRNDDSLAKEFEWLEIWDRMETSPASVWVPDYEEETISRAVSEIDYFEATDASELSLPETASQAGVLDIIEKQVDDRETESGPQVRVLEDSQVDSGKASFAAEGLNQTNAEDIIEASVAARPSSPETSSRGRLLDESQVLPSEASFATAMSNEPLGPRSYSPVEEFLARTNLSSKTLMVASLLVVLIVAVSALVILELTTGLFSSPQMVNTATHSSPAKTEAVPVQPEPLPNAKSLAPVAGSKPQKEVGGPRTSNPAAGKLEGVGESPRQTLSERVNSETSRKVSASDAKSETPRKASLEGARSVASRGKPAGDSRRPSPASPKKVEVKVPSPTGGAQRPRTVKRSSSPGQ